MIEYIESIPQGAWDSETDLVQLPQDGLVQEKTIFGTDNIGTPDYSTLLDDAKSKRRREELTPNPKKAEFYLSENALDYPHGFEEPEPFVLNSKEWEMFCERKKAVEKRREEALRGTF